MKDKMTKQQMRLYLMAAVILLIGLGSSVFIYLNAENGSESGLVDQLENSKIYRHDLELIGGKANVLADEFAHWFGGLWHGKSLALTVALIALVISLGFFLVAYLSPLDPGSADGDEKER